MHGWWSLWAKPDIDQLYVQVAYIQDELVGIAPFYIQRAHYFGKLLPVKRLQFIGHRLSGPDGLRSECLGLIVRPDLDAPVSELLLESIFCNSDWDEVVLSDLIVEHDFHRLVKDRSLANKYQARVLDSSICYAVKTTGDFEGYVAGLGKNTRLKLYGRRKHLAKLGRVELVVDNFVDIDKVIDHINEFHQIRFNSITFSEKRRALVKILVSAAKSSDIRWAASLLQLDGQVISAMLNLLVGGKVYNIQLGYIESFDSKLSLGTLHLGYEIEAAFRNSKIHSFDLLAGGGKNGDYKKSLAQPKTNLESIMIIRAPIVKWVYRVNDQLKRALRSAQNYGRLIKRYCSGCLRNVLQSR